MEAHLADFYLARVIHREDYHRVLMDEASILSVKTLLSAEVSTVHFGRTELRLRDGRIIQGDVIVRADRLWPATRPLLLGSPSPPVETGDLAYRGTFTREQLLALGDLRIKKLCACNSVNVLLRPGRHCVLYPVRGGKQSNLVLLRPNNLPPRSRTAQGDVEEMRETFKGWDETYVLLLIICLSLVSLQHLLHPRADVWTTQAHETRPLHLHSAKVETMPSSRTTVLDQGASRSSFATMYLYAHISPE